MLRLDQLTVQRGAKPLLTEASLTIHPGQKVGLVGPNGSGKSSLFAVLRGELDAEGGRVDYPKGWHLVHVAQETPALDQSALDYVLAGDEPLQAATDAIARAEAEHNHDALAHAHALFDELDGHSAPARAGQLLAGLGFTAAEQSRAVKTFSGGWRMRLNIARALLRPGDLLLLDEPTNHLDLDAILWFVQWLQRFPGAALIISHDRDFLDRTVSAIAHVDQAKLVSYRGNYSDFVRQRAERQAQQQAAFSAQQRQIAHLQSFVDRFRAKATKATQAQSRLKQLEKLERVAALEDLHGFDLSFPKPSRVSNPLLRLDDLAAGYGDTPIMQGVKLNLAHGDRIGLLGRNGAGKSTLVKILAGSLAPLHGTRHSATGLVIGYFAQHQLEQLDDQDSPLRTLQRQAPQSRESELRAFLGRYGFQGDQALAPIGPFSGGEKARLVLALLAWQKPHVLLLDEPTNHLDLEMRDALALALQDYEGAVVIVAHDRALLESSVDSFWVVHDRQVIPFDGNLDDYQQWRANQTNPESPTGAEAGGPASSADRKAQRRQEAALRQQLAARRKPLQKQQGELEQRMEQLQQRLKELERQVSSPDFYASGNAEHTQATLREQGQLSQELHTVEESWLDIQGALEELAEGLVSSDP